MFNFNVPYNDQSLLLSYIQESLSNLRYGMLVCFAENFACNGGCCGAAWWGSRGTWTAGSPLCCSSH